jgi:tRNA (guanine37-N1)-methyltransferase
VEESRAATGVDTVGDIAIVRLEGASAAEKKRVARAILLEAKAVKCVYEQQGGIEGDFRLRKLRHLAGEERTLTVHRENGCTYKVDVARCYFSPRLASERSMIADEAGKEESVLNMFAGVGPFSILVAKRKKAKVLSCELNGFACGLHEENNRANKVEKLVKVLNADAMALPKLTRRRFDRILMPHPSQADRFLPTALALTRSGSVIHYYRHVLGRDEKEAAGNMAGELDSLLPRNASYEIRRVREVGPRWLEMAADIRVR